MTSPADQVIAALRSGHDDLSAHVTKLDEQALTSPSAASEWDVAHVLSHLGSGAEISLAALDRALSGGAPAPEGFNQSVWARWDAMGPVEQRDGFLESNQRLVERYEGLSEDARNSVRIDLGFLPEPLSVADAGRLRLVEFALHAWDARAGADPTAKVAPEAVPLILDGVRPLLGWISKPERLDGRPVEVTVEVPSRAFGLVIGDQVEVGERGERADGVLRIPEEAFVRLLTGRLGERYTPAEVEASGSVALDDLRHVFPGY